MTKVQKLGIKESLSYAQRREYLRKQIESNKYKGKLLDLARYYAARYGWLAKGKGKAKKYLSAAK